MRRARCRGALDQKRGKTGERDTDALSVGISRPNARTRASHTNIAQPPVYTATMLTTAGALLPQQQVLPHSLSSCPQLPPEDVDIDSFSLFQRSRKKQIK